MSLDRGVVDSKYIGLPEARWNPSRRSKEQYPYPSSAVRKKKTFKHEIDPGRQSEQAVRLTFALVRRINGNLQQVPRLEALQSARVEDLVVHLPDW